jgi:PAS domain S-box-containing protein
VFRARLVASPAVVLMSSDVSFERFLEAVPDATLVVDAGGRIMRVNGRAVELFGFTHEELVGQPIEFVLPDGYRSGHVEDRTAMGSEWSGLRKDGARFPVEILGSLIEMDGRIVTMAAIRDLTARKKTEAANRAKDHLLAILSHDLRTPLQTVLGWAHLLKSGRLEPAAAQHALEVMIQNIRQQTEIVTDLLEVSQIITGDLQVEMTPLDLPLVMEAALDVVRPVAEAKGVTLLATLDPWAGPVLGDAERLKQVLWNLVSNAVKFTPEGGRVHVRLEPRGAHARIVVQDTGRGIAPEFLPHIFDRFTQADGSGTVAPGGLGLGLAISRHLVELHAGTLSAESAGEGQGATFTVELPATRAAAVSPPSWLKHRADGVPTERALAGVRILVVDDDPDTLDLLSTALRQEDATVTAAASAREAFEILQDSGADVLVSDIAMPGENGYRLMERIRRASRVASIPAVAVTAYARAEDREAALRAGYHAHVAKPVEPAVLAREVARIVGRA